MKRRPLFLTVILAFALCLGGPAMAADPYTVLEQYNIIGPSLKDQADQPITRGACAGLLIRSFGCVNTEVEEALKQNYYYASFFEDMETAGAFYHYVQAAGYCRIMVGEPGSDSDSFRCAADRNATVEEAVAFVMRCLEGETEDMDRTYTRALESGLLTAAGIEHLARQDAITTGQFCALLHQMLYRPFAIYFDTFEWIYKFSAKDYACYNDILADIHNGALRPQRL